MTYNNFNTYDYQTLDLELKDSKSGVILTEDSDPDRLSDLFAVLTERLETLEEKRKTVKSLTEVSETLTQGLSYLSLLDGILVCLKDSETVKTDGLIERSEDLIKDSKDLLYSIKTLIEVSDLHWLSLTPIMIEEYYNLEDLKEISILRSSVFRLERVSESLETLREDLEYNKERVSKILTQISKSRKEIEDLTRSLGIVQSLDHSDHGLSLSEISDLETRVSGSLSLLSESLESLDSFSDSFDQVSESLTLFRDDIETRQKRLIVRYFLAKDTKTEIMISESLKEKVSISFLDSGGTPKYDPETGQYIGSSSGYGRNFERNSLRDFESESPVSAIADQYDLTVSINLYHFLKESLEYDPVLDSLFLEYSETPDNDRESWLSLQHNMIKDLESIFESLGDPISGLYGDCSGSFCVNTYNHESLLSQVIQFYYMEIDQETKIFLSIHNGADVRGGYTRPVFYSAGSQYDETKILDDQRLYAWIENPETGDQIVDFYTDDGYHLYCDSDLERLDQSLYDFRTQKDRQKDQTQIERLKSKIEDLESIIIDHVTYGDSEDSKDRQTLDRLLEIKSEKISDLETLEEKYKYNHSRSLTFSTFRTMEISDLPDLDLEDLTDHYASNDPIIYYQTDPKTGRQKLLISGLGYLHFGF